MRVVHSTKPLPRKWAGMPGADRAIMIADIAVTRRSRLRAKVLVFRNARDLQRFWRIGLGKTHREALGRRCVGAVNRLVVECGKVHHKSGKVTHARVEVDPRYFCVIGLCATNLGAEVVSHEAMHAGFAYAKRLGGHGARMWPCAATMDEEAVCYPAGRIYSEINKVLHDQGAYAIYERHRRRRA